MALLLLLCDIFDLASQFLGVLDQSYSCPPLMCVLVDLRSYQLSPLNMCISDLRSYLVMALLLLLCDIVDQASVSWRVGPAS